LTAKKLLNTVDLNQTLQLGYIIFILGGLLLLISGYENMPLFIMVGAISILTFGNGFLLPLGTAGVISSFSKSTGYASGLLGFLQLGSAALSSSLVGLVTQNSIFHLGIYVFTVTIIGTVIFFVFKKEII
jgi:DHA1 family bicyclomycin/chloramphenicol resistance-like MFS transporter